MPNDFDFDSQEDRPKQRYSPRRRGKKGTGIWLVFMAWSIFVAVYWLTTPINILTAMQHHMLCAVGIVIGFAIAFAIDKASKE